jgi:hypothetical protein
MTNAQQAELNARRQRYSDNNSWRDGTLNVDKLDCKDIIFNLKQHVIRCIYAKYPGYAHDAAIYNDLLWQIHPELKYTIEYDGDDAAIKDNNK